VLLTLAGSLSSLSAAELHGRVLDPDGRAVAGAMVRLHERTAIASHTATSDSGGAYSFDSVAAGEYLVEAESEDGALGATDSITIRQSGESRDIELAVRGPRSKVLVTASATPLSLDEIGKAADIVDESELGRRDEMHVSEALRPVAGLRVIQHGGPGSLVIMRFRGMREQDTAVLIDGFRFRDATSIQGDATAFSSDLMTVNSESIEVVRGSGSSLYGSHAMGGVINLRTATGGGRPHGEIRAEGGGLGLLRGVARAGGGVADDRLLYSGGVAHLNVSNGVDGFDPARNTSGQGFARWSFTPKLTLSGRVFASDAFAALNESPTTDPSLDGNLPAAGLIPAVGLSSSERERYETGAPFSPGGATFVQGFNDPDSRRTSSFFAGALRLRQEFSSRAALELSYSGVGTDRSFRDGPAGSGPFEPLYSNASLFEGRTDTLGAVGRFGAGARNLLTVGYEFERESYDNFNTDENPDVSLRPNDRAIVTQRTHAVYAQDQIRWLDGRLQLLLSGRAQSAHLSAPQFEGGATPYDGKGFSRPKGALTGDGSLSYFMRSSGTKVRAHVGNSFRNPAAYERFGASFFAGSFSAFGDPRLKPERSVSADAGVDQYFARSKVRLSAAWFYTHLQETIHFDFSGLIDPATDPYGRFGGYRNTGGGTSRGVELSSAVSAWQGFDFTASYTYTNAESNRPTFGSDFFQTLGISDHMVSFVANQRIGRFTVTTDFFAASKYPFVFFGAARPYAFKGPKKMDVVAGYDLPVGVGFGVRLYGKLENVFDTRYYENGFQTPGRWGVAGLAVRF
jgi:iron complex outermembrane receptor protein